MPPIEPAVNIAAHWEAWCGETPWSAALREFGALGGKVQWWCGYPRSASAIPLTFALFHPDGTKIDCSYRLKDIRRAVRLLAGDRAGEAEHT